jgi:EmrB/QacA subfamily drug resistance transporter
LGSAGAAATAHPAGHSAHGRKWLVLVAMVFGLFMPMLDNLVVNVALPTIQRKLGTGVSGLQWIIDAYTLTFASFMLTGGSLGDLYGRKKFFMGGLVLFTLGSLACGLSQSTDQLVAFRSVQGLGAALLLPGSLSIITATFQGKERGTAIGIWAAMSGLAVAVGPLVGGYLVEHFSWHSIFFINIPVGIFGLLLTAIVVRESRDAASSRRVDLPGLITGTAGLFFLVYALIEGNAKGWSDQLILGAFGLAAVLLIVFLIIESKRTYPMLPLSFFRNSTFAAANVVAASVFFALFGTTFFLALYLQNIRGFTPFQTGLRLLPFTACILIISPISGKLSDRHGSRVLMTIGTALAAGGMALLLRTEVHSSYQTVILPAFIVLGSGMALTMAPMTAAVMGSVDPRRAGVASAATNTTRELGGVLGIALLGAVVTASFKTRFLANLMDAGLPGPVAHTIVDRASSAAAAGGGSAATFKSQAPPGTPAAVINQVAGAAQHAFVNAIHRGMLIAIGFILLASLCSALFVRSHVRRTELAKAPDDASGSEASEPVPEEPPSDAHLQSPAGYAVAAVDDMINQLGPGGVPETAPHASAVPRDPTDKLKQVLSDLPFRAGVGTVGSNLEEVAGAALAYYRNGYAGIGPEPASLNGGPGAGGSLEVAGRQGDLTDWVAGPSNRNAIWTIRGYLTLEQRFGRVSSWAAPEAGAVMLMGAVVSRALGAGTEGRKAAKSDDQGDPQFVKDAVRIMLDGMGDVDAGASGPSLAAGRRLL